MTARQSARDVRNRYQAAVPALLVLANWLVYGQVLGFRFLHWDDHTCVVPHLERFGGLSLESVGWAFQNVQHGWRTPLPYLSLFADAHLFGMQPAGFHFTNLLIHTASTLLLYYAFRHMTEQLLPSAFVAMVFAVHPLHVEPVAWVTGRWELLCGFFWIAGMCCYAHYCSRPRWTSYLLVAACYVAALLSKPMALTFPCALCLLDIWPLGRCGTGRPTIRRLRQLGFEKLPLFGIMFAALAVTWAAKAQFLGAHGLLQFSLSDRLLNAAQTYAIYTAQTLWPSQLTFFYVHPATLGGFDVYRVLAAISIVAGVTLFVLREAGRRPYLLVGWLWYIGVFVPAIGLLQVEHHARADRYTYLPLIGLTVMLAWGLPAVVASQRVRQLLAGCFVVFLACTAHFQTGHWRDSETLFRYGIEVDPNNYKAWANLANIAARQGNWGFAEQCAERGVAIWPHDYRAVENLGLIKWNRGDIHGARLQFERLPTDGRDTVGRHLLAVCLAEEGELERALALVASAAREFPHSRHGRAASALVQAAAAAAAEVDGS